MSERVRKRGEPARQGTVQVYNPQTSGGPYMDPVTVGTAGSAYADYQEIRDSKHEWPPRKGSYVGGSLYLKKETITSGTSVGEFPYTNNSPWWTWGPRKLSGNLVASADNTGGITYPSYLASDYDQMLSQVVNQAFSKAYSSKATLLVTAGEFHKTIGMMNRPMGQARNMLGLMTKRYKSLLSRGVRATQAAGAAWLEYRMGWKPLLYDMQNIAKAIHAQLSKIDATYDQTYRSSITQNWGGGGVKSASGGYFSAAKLDWSASLHRKVSAGVILRENLFDESSRPWQQLFGVQLHDVAPAVWELMPYSFVIDRFVDVQTWLEAIQPRPNTQVMFSWVTTVDVRNETTSFNTAACSVGGANHPLEVAMVPKPSDSVNRQCTEVTRAVGVSPSIIPSLNVRELKLNQHLDHASLVLGQLVGLFPEVRSRNFGSTLDKRKWVSLPSRKMR